MLSKILGDLWPDVGMHEGIKLFQELLISLGFRSNAQGCLKAFSSSEPVEHNV